MRVAVAVAAAALAGAGIAGETVLDWRNTHVPSYKTHFAFPKYSSLEQWEIRRGRLKLQILSAAGLLPMPARTDLKPRLVKKTEYAGYAVETLLLETFPGFQLGANVYRPLNPGNPRPAVLVPHGHWKRGRLEHLPEYSVPALCINLALQGYVAIAYDMVGYNDTQQMSHSFTGRREQLWSFHPMAVQTWNSIRVLDYLESRADVDGQRIAVSGASGGGTQTFLLAAIDDRIKAAAPVNMISAHMQGGDPCEEAPGLHLGTFNVEIAAMVAPRPMLIVSSTRDWTKNTPREEFPSIQSIYQLYGAADKVSNAHIDAPHNYNRQSREAVYGFLARNVGAHLPAVDLVDRDVAAPPAEVLRAGADSKPVDAEVFRHWREAGPKAQEGSLDDWRTALRAAIGAEWPETVSGRASDGRLILRPTQGGAVVVGQYTTGTGKPLLVVDRDVPTDAGRPVLRILLFRSDERRRLKERFDRNFFSYNRSDSANQVQDVLIAARYLQQVTGELPEIIASGESALPSFFAAAVAPVQMSMTPVPDTPSETKLLKNFFVPGVMRAGGLAAAKQVYGSKQ